MADINLLPVPISAGDVISLDGADIQARRVMATHKVRAKLTTDQANVTGNGTWATVIFNSEEADPEGLYNSSTGVITPSVSGLYRFDIHVTLSGGSSNVTAMGIRVFDIGGTAVLRVGSQTQTAANAAGMTLSCEVDLVAAATYRIEAAGFGVGADTLEIEEGNASFGDNRTWFNMRLVG